MRTEAIGLGRQGDLDHAGTVRHVNHAALDESGWGDLNLNVDLRSGLAGTKSYGRGRGRQSRAWAVGHDIIFGLRAFHGRVRLRPLVQSQHTGVVSKKRADGIPSRLDADKSGNRPDRSWPPAPRQFESHALPPDGFW